jgi:hypothetical protein
LFETTEILVVSAQFFFAEKKRFAKLHKMSKKYGREKKPFGRVKTPFQKHKYVLISDKHATAHSQK